MDAVIRSQYHFQPHTEVMTHQMTQPSEKIILERNAEMRKNPGIIRDLGAKQVGPGDSWGRQIACIPELMLYKVVHNDGFDTYSKDKKRAASEMQRFLATDDGRSCLVRDTTTKSSTKYFKGV